MIQNSQQYDLSARRFMLNLWAVLWARIGIFFGLLCIAILLSLAIIILSQPTYRSSASIKLDIMKLASMSAEIIPTSYLADDLIVDTEIQILSSRGVAEHVINLGDAMAILGDDTLNKEASIQKALQAFARGLRIEREGKTSIVTVYFSHPDPKFAAFMADGLIDTYLEFKQKLQTERIAQRRAFLEQELQKTQLRLQSAEKKSLDFARDKQLPYGTQKTLLELEEEILKRDQIEQTVALQLTEQKHRSLENLVANIHDPSNLYGAILVQQINPQISYVQSEYARVSLDIASLIAAGNKPPANSGIMRQIEALGYSLTELVTAARDVSLSDVKLSNERLNETAVRYENVRSKTELSVADQNILRTLKDEESTIRTEFDILNTQLQNIWSQNDFLRAPAERISNAIPSLKAYEPRPMRIIMSCLAIAFMLFGLVALVQRQIFAKVELASDIITQANFRLIYNQRPSFFSRKFAPKQQTSDPMCALAKLLIGRSNHVVGFIPMNCNSPLHAPLNALIDHIHDMGKTVEIINLGTHDIDITREAILVNADDDNLDEHLNLTSARADLVVIIFDPADRFMEVPKAMEHCGELLISIQKGQALIEETRDALDLIHTATSRPINIIFQNSRA